MERPQQLRGRLDPIALRAAGNVQAVTGEEVFLSVKRHMVAELADDDLSDEPWTGDATNDRPLGWRWAYHTVLAIAAGVLGPHMHVHFQLGRHVIEDLSLVLADAILRPPTTTARLLGGSYVEFVAIMGQLRKVQLSTTTTAMRSHLLSSRFAKQF